MESVVFFMDYLLTYVICVFLLYPIVTKSKYGFSYSSYSFSAKQAITHYLVTIRLLIHRGMSSVHSLVQAA